MRNNPGEVVVLLLKLAVAVLVGLLTKRNIRLP